MGRERYRHTIRILRRAADAEADGGYDADPYVPVATTSAHVRDESESEYAEAESARIAHALVFSLRARDVLSDDLIEFGGKPYRVRRVDRYDYGGREIRVRAEATGSRYTVIAPDGEG